MGEARGHGYRGETRLFLFQNLHRYFLYFALLFIVILTIDGIRACIGPEGFRVTVGSLVLLANAALLGIFTFSCNSLRHLVGGGRDNFTGSCGQVCFRLWRGVSALNKHHAFWAWVSLFGVGFADFYVWMVSSGRLHDPVLIG